MKNIIAAIECASVPDNPGGFVTPLLRNGWQYVIDEIEKAYKHGIRTVMLHRPNGESLEGEIMNLDSRVDLLNDPAASVIIKGQGSFLTVIERKFHDLRIIAYLGSSQDPDWAERAQRQDYSQLIDRLGRSLKPWIDCPFCDLAFDHAGRFDDDNPHGGFVVFVHQLLGLSNRTVYVEPQPSRWSMTAGMPSIVLERWWRRYADKSRPVVRWWSGHEMTADDSTWRDINEWLADCEATRCVPCVNVQQLESIKGTG